MSKRRSALSHLILSSALLGAATACNSDHMTQPDDKVEVPLITTLLVSAPSATNVSRQLQFSLLTSAGDTYAYVSARPGTALGASASITNRTRNRVYGTENSTSVTIADGGFDPVSVAASAGDTLQIEFLSADRTSVLVGAAVVPRTRPPTIVRTNPRGGKKDVPLNIRFEIIFSDPIDPSTITTQNIQVTTGGVAVAGTVVQTNDYTVEFVPAQPLQPNTSFQVAVHTGVRDVIGVALDNEFKTEFETGAVSDAPLDGCSPDTDCFAFVRDGAIVTSDNGNPAKVFVSQGLRPSWSPDRTHIAFTRPAGNQLAPWQLCVADIAGATRCAADGLNGTVAGKPSWSPDGTKLAFSVFYLSSCPGRLCGEFSGYYSSLLILNTATMQITALDTPPVRGPTWSPDGRKIAVVSTGALATINPDGSDLSYLTISLGSYTIIEAAWSPDASSLALTLNDENACPWYCDTAFGIVRADGTQLKVLDRAHACGESFGCAATEAYIAGAPEWVGNGDRVAYTITTGECYVDDRASCGTNVMVANVSDGHIGVLLAGGGYPSFRR